MGMANVEVTEIRDFAISSVVPNITQIFPADVPKIFQITATGYQPYAGFGHCYRL
ncbi:MAG: hypothetical protein R3C26_08275 [Calditrichia bacterium]